MKLVERKIRITLIEDNEALADAIAYRLRDRGHSVDKLSNGLDAHNFLKSDGADLIILDLNLPGMDGLNILKALRERGDGTATLLLTARGSTSDRVAGLDLGADDYLVKPFEMDELEARIRALLRRRDLRYESYETLGPLHYDRAARLLKVDGQALSIPRKELAALECLLENKGRIVSKTQLLDHVYGVGSDTDMTVIEPHISRLRQRLSKYGISIRVARGLGYLIEHIP